MLRRAPIAAILLRTPFLSTLASGMFTGGCNDLSPPSEQDTDEAAFPGRGVVTGRSPGVFGATEDAATLHPDTTVKPLGGPTPLGPQTVIHEPSPVRAHLSFGVELHRCSHPVFAKQGATRFEVRQGSVRNCPLPALLAAMAYTKQLGKITVTEKRTPAVSSYKGKSITVDRYFEVTFSGQAPIQVTDRFWGSGPCSMEYARSTEKALWVSLIEKAYVKLRVGNTYEKLSDVNASPDANTVVEDLTGAPVANVVVVASQSDDQLRQQLQKARTTPMIARLDNPQSNNAHAYTVEGMDPAVADEVLLFDALKQVSLSLSLKSFKSQYSHLLFP